ncbi:MAG: hypothetical protein IKM30_06800 [Oscillospiraceae bacterium]|nr:hypothetical protein [Oscillospiraceae bacterium]
MTSKNYAVIPVLAAIVMIPQLLFWWFSPVSAAAYLAVYIGGTMLTVGIPAAYFLTYWSSNLRQTAGLAVVSGVLELAVIMLSALLLGMDVSVRSAVFVFIITALMCLIVLIPMISSARKAQKQGVYPVMPPAEPDN